jgi:phosphatidylglycerophosphatase A
MRKLIITFFGAGLSPLAPGTVGSIAAALVLWFLYGLAGAPGFGVWQIILLFGLAISSALTVGLGPWAIEHFGKKDPQPCVMDEVAGICLTNLLLPTSTIGRQAMILFISMLAFRLFDITKPPPARQLEARPAGWGILLDDLAAAVYANLVCQVILRWGMRGML